MREKLIELLEIVTQEYAEEIADFLIKNGTVIPVRCGECKYRHEHDDFGGTGGDTCMITDDFVCYDHYCSDGIPKKDEE